MAPAGGMTPIRPTWPPVSVVCVAPSRPPAAVADHVRPRPGLDLHARTVLLAVVVAVILISLSGLWPSRR
jgi:hypothetical protein